MTQLKKDMRAFLEIHLILLFLFCAAHLLPGGVQAAAAVLGVHTVQGVPRVNESVCRASGFVRTYYTAGVVIASCHSSAMCSNVVHMCVCTVLHGWHNGLHMQDVTQRHMNPYMYIFTYVRHNYVHAGTRKTRATLEVRTYTHMHRNSR